MQAETPQQHLAVKELARIPRLKKQERDETSRTAPTEMSDYVSKFLKSHLRNQCPKTHLADNRSGRPLRNPDVLTIDTIAISFAGNERKFIYENIA